MGRVNQVLDTPDPRPNSAGASGSRSAIPASPARTAPRARTTLRSRLAESSEEDLEVPVNPEKKARRLLHHWKRLTGKVIFLITTATRSAVERHWEQQGSTKDQPPQEVLTQPLPQAKGKARRRSDLTGIGEPIPPKSKQYPISRATCQHVHPETGEQSLQAAGGAHLVNGERVPFYTWVCVRCGARWQRTPAGQSPSVPPRDPTPPQTTLVEPLRPNSGFRALAPAAGSRPDVPIKSEGRMRPCVEARSSSRAQTPDVMMIHSDAEGDL